MDNQEQLFISLEEASKILGVNVRQVSRMIKIGQLRAKDINASGQKRHIWRVLKEDVTKTNEEDRVNN